MHRYTRTKTEDYKLHNTNVDFAEYNVKSLSLEDCEPVHQDRTPKFAENLQCRKPKIILIVVYIVNVSLLTVGIAREAGMKPLNIGEALKKPNIQQDGGQT